MHSVGVWALQSVAAAPKRYRRAIVCPRPTLGAARGFLSSPARPARSDEPNAARDDDLVPENVANGSGSASEGDGGAGHEASSAASSSFSSNNTAAGPAAPSAPPVPTAPKIPIPAAAATAGTQPSDGSKEALSPAVSSGSSSGGRGRSGRSRNIDGMPAITLPDWFLKDRVRLHDGSKTASATPSTFSADLAAASHLIFPKTSTITSTFITTANSPSPSSSSNSSSPSAAGAPTETLDIASFSAKDRETVHRYLDAWLDGAAWDARKVAQAAAQLRNGQHMDVISRRGAAVAAAASYAAAALADHPEILHKLPVLPFGTETEQAVKDALDKGSLYALARAADDAVSQGTRTSTDPGERLVYRELYSTIATELLAVSPTKPTRDLKRPVSVLTILNYKGRSKAAAIVDDVARALSAHVVHLDAGSIADIVGPYLGQTAYWARGNIAMLGYSASLRNGQSASRFPANGEDDIDVPVSLPRLPVSIMRSSGVSRLSMKAFVASEPDDRWGDLKINNVLEAMIHGADTASVRSLSSSSSSSSSASKLAPVATEPHSLILHVHNFLELSSSGEGAQVLGKLRSLVDRMWQKGRKVVLVGSTSTDMNACPALLDKAEELRQEDCHIIPYRVADTAATRAMEVQDAFNENMRNIRAMIAALTGTPLNQDALAWGTAGSESEGPSTELTAALSSTIYDVHWVYRFAVQVIGSSGHVASSLQASRPSAASAVWKHALDEHAFLQALRSIQDQDQMWKESAGAQEPYFSPLTVNRSDDSDAEPTREIRVGGVLKKVSSSDYTEYEKKFLPDLIDASDIKTTFDDIVIPEEVKESLKALTSLSLIRPEAFLYGVLAAERIPGCLLYGPPGTGKTLMAKAVAKQSGANMLEISAASINDMWVGNSEKNVQALFSLARKLSPVVIFLDEADALLGARQTRPGRGGHRETINQFLREWDGLTSNMKAFIMVATNRPFDLDEAVLRRLPRRILVDLPLRDGRLAILRVMLRDELLDSASVSLEMLAAETELYSGSDLKNLCVAAAMEAVREEVRAQAAHTGPEPFVFSERRVLNGRHFERALQEIGASISEDMSSLQAIRRFDERYGDNSSKRRRKRRGMGFEVVPGPAQSEETRVRQPA
ncbi:hypothetical protein SCUCBS95973_006817 [Sporothrix curviconia]|uniref:AAA+ ATPase domain-containing protein n=1 Tax=Sporothrix curviconia TaxID=1260050 RepID=A0ABP0C9F8_9PEZI